MIGHFEKLAFAANTIQIEIVFFRMKSEKYLAMTKKNVGLVSNGNKCGITKGLRRGGNSC